MEAKLTRSMVHLGHAAACLALAGGAAGLLVACADHDPAARTPAQTQLTARAQSTTAGTPTYFAVPADTPQLLPFRVRMARVMAVSGLPAGDPALAELRANRTQLGDHDFANGLRADNTWSALKMVTWVRAIQPVCRSAAMQQRYPDLPAQLPALIEVAWGRSATAQDLALVQEALTGLTLTAASRRETLCVAVLSSMEFVAH